ncbi:unnamed protein product [Hermetia illucens]|nr:unnamed protein product [Hermetia illucens]
MKLLLTCIQFNDEKLSDEERKKKIHLFQMLLLAHMEKLKQKSLDAEPVKWRKSEVDSAIVEAPYEKESGGDYKTIEIAIDTEAYSLRDCFTYFFLQIPKGSMVLFVSPPPKGKLTMWASICMIGLRKKKHDILLKIQLKCFGEDIALPEKATTSPIAST